MAITSNLPAQYRNLQNANYVSLPVSASQHIYQGQLVGVQATTAVCLPITDVSTLTFGGVAASESDNTSGASSATSVNLWTAGDFALKTTGTVAWGNPVYASDNGTVAVSGSSATAGIYVGRAMEPHSTLSGYTWIRLDGPKKTGYPTV